MSIQSEISRLQSGKTAILSAIRAKGVAVSATATLEDCPGYIENIPTPMGVATSRNSATAKQISFSGLEGAPKRFMVMANSTVNSTVTGNGKKQVYTPYVIALFFDGEILSGHYTQTSADTGNMCVATAFTQSFTDGTLTIASANPNFGSTTSYTLFYEY